MTTITQYITALRECRPSTTDEQAAYDAAFVFLTPRRIFRLWVDSVVFWWRVRNGR